MWDSLLGQLNTMGKTTNQMTKCSIEIYEKWLILVVLYVIALYGKGYIHKIPKGIYLSYQVE